MFVFLDNTHFEIMISNLGIQIHFETAKTFSKNLELFHCTHKIDLLQLNQQKEALSLNLFHLFIMVYSANSNVTSLFL